MKVRSKLRRLFTQDQGHLTRLGFILLVALIPRWYYWRQFGTISWDGGNHSNGGILVARTLLHLDNPVEYASTLAVNYPNAVGSLFFYPYGYDLLTAASYLLFGFTDFAARLPNMLSSVFIFIPVYLLGARIYTRNAGYFAAFFAAITPYFIQWGGRSLVDVPLTFFLTLSIYFTIRAIEEDTKYDWIAVGLSLGFAAQLKPIGLFFGPILFGFALYRRPALIRDLRYYASGLLAIAITSTYFISGIIVSKLFPRGDHIDDLVLHWFTSAVTKTESQDPVLPDPQAIIYYIRLLPDQLSLPIVGIAVLGIILAYYHHKRFDDNELLLVGVILYVYLVFTALSNKDWRYTMPFYPAFLVFAGFAVNEVRTRDVHLRKAVPVVVSLLLVSTAVIATAETFDGGPDPSPDAGTDKVAALVSNQSSATIQIEDETNWICGECVTFYVLAQDPDLRYSVDYTVRDSADWMVSAQPINDSRFELYRQVGEDNRTHIYKRVNDDGNQSDSGDLIEGVVVGNERVITTET